MKQIDSGYKLIEVLSDRRGRADTVVNVATVEFRFGAVVLIEMISLAGSHFSTHGLMVFVRQTFPVWPGL